MVNFLGTIKRGAKSIERGVESVLPGVKAIKESIQQRSFAPEKRFLTEHLKPAKTPEELMNFAIGFVGPEGDEARALAKEVGAPALLERIKRGIDQGFKYVKNEPIDIVIGKNDINTARNIRNQFTGVKNSQIVRGNQFVQSLKKLVPNKLERQGMFWYKAAEGNLDKIREVLGETQPISKDLKLFAEEARKYKSAEEFVGDAVHLKRFDYLVEKSRTADLRGIKELENNVNKAEKFLRQRPDYKKLTPFDRIDTPEGQDLMAAREHLEAKFRSEKRIQLTDFYNQATKEIGREVSNNFKPYEKELRAALNLSPQAQDALREGAKYYSESGQVAKELGTIRGIVENYQNRIYVPKPPSDFVKSELKKGISTFTRHGKSRVYESEFDAVMAGEKFATTDFTDALSIHNEEMSRVNTAQKLYQALPESGIAAKVPIGQIPKGWERIEGFKQFPQKEEIVAPQGIAKGLQAITDPDYTKRIDSLRGLSRYQGLVKTVDLSYSFFHHFTMAMQTIYQGTGRDMFKLPIMSKVLTRPEFKDMELDFVRHTGITSNVEVTQDVLRDLTRKNPDFFSKVTNLPIVKQLLNIADKNTEFLFGKMQRMFKVQDYGRKISNWVTSHPNATNEEVRSAKVSLAKEVNNAYGGLNWEAMGMTKSNLSILRALLLAPDWTISNIELARQAFSGGAGGNAARKSIIGGLIKGMVLTEFFNQMLTGHFTDENKKGHGLEIEVAPNVYVSFLRGGLGDLVKWSSNVIEEGPIAGTSRFLSGKLAPIPRTAIGALTGTQYVGKPISKKIRGQTPEQQVAQKTIDYLEFFGRSAGPIPFGLSGIFQAAPDTTLTGGAFVATGLGRFSAPRKQRTY